MKYTSPVSGDAMYCQAVNVHRPLVAPICGCTASVVELTRSEFGKLRDRLLSTVPAAAGTLSHPNQPPTVLSTWFAADRSKLSDHWAAAGAVRASRVPTRRVVCFKGFRRTGEEGR